MTALKDLLAAVEAADNGPENGHVIDNGYTRRDYVSGEIETIRPREFEADDSGTWAEAAALADEAPEPLAPAAELARSMEPERLVLPAPEPATRDVVGPTRRTVVIEQPSPEQFRAEYAQEPAPAPMEYTILERRHNKRGFTYYQVTLPERVERELFNELRAACILANGWYSRAWAGQPGGFAFRDRLAAQAFANEHLGPPAPMDRETLEQAALAAVDPDDYYELADTLHETPDQDLQAIVRRAN